MSARTIWGKVVLYLREHKQVALHVACGDITDVDIEGNKLIINVYDGMLVDLLKDGKKEIRRALNWQGRDLDVEINVKTILKSEAEQDIEKLKEIFGDYLKVKGGQ